MKLLAAVAQPILPIEDGVTAEHNALPVASITKKKKTERKKMSKLK